MPMTTANPMNSLASGLSSWEAGLSALQILDEVSRAANTIWVTGRQPEYVGATFGPELGRAAVAQVEARVRQRLAPRPALSVAALPRTPAIEAMEPRGVLSGQPMFSEMTPTGIRWPDGREEAVDVIIGRPGFAAHWIIWRLCNCARTMAVLS